MISIDLVNTPPPLADFKFLSADKYPILFFGCLIKNEYDNQRLELNKAYKPVSIIHQLNVDTDDVDIVGVALKGIKLTPNENLKNVINLIQHQEKLNMNLAVYENILNQYNLTCTETYGFYAPGLYPIDFKNLKSVCDDNFNVDNKIIQHILNLDEKVFDFQKFASLNLFILTV
jgi:hypothetical protein